jgi:hypothetical protein
VTANTCLINQPQASTVFSAVALDTSLWGVPPHCSHVTISQAAETAERPTSYLSMCQLPEFAGATYRRVDFLQLLDRIELDPGSSPVQRRHPSALCSSGSSTTASCPLLAARCSAVPPSSSFTSTLALRFSSNRTTASCPSSP